jgi:hypothetical protein
MRSSIAKLIAPSVELVLEAEGVSEKLVLKLAWTMRSVMVIETQLRQLGIDQNILQDPSSFWKNLDCCALAIAVWACSWQEHPDLRGEDGLDIITSYLITENWGKASQALKDCFLESLSKERRDDIKKREQEERNGGAPGADPTSALVQ